MKIERVVESLFPDGYLDIGQYSAHSEHDARLPRGIGTLPFLCTDLFAIAAVVLQRSGAYHHVAPDNPSAEPERLLRVTQDMRERWQRIGKEWRGEITSSGPVDSRPPQELLDIWDSFWVHRSRSIFEELAKTSSAPSWWMPTLELLCIADEAGSGLGFELAPATVPSAQSVLINREATKRVLVDDAANFSLSTADPDVACVLPKSRTPWLGCTLRSLSHNLALLPPRGLARAYWLPYQGKAKKGTVGNLNEQSPGGPNALNCLLIPMPYRIPATAFSVRRSQQERWGWFHIRPDWCKSSVDGPIEKNDPGFVQFFSFVQALINAAERDVGQIHVLVFPESSLSSAVFRQMKDCLQETNVELVVAGLFDKSDAENRAVEHGNYAAFAVVGENGLISFRQKHHRWKLDRGQIQNYALGATLDPNFGWWEDIDILSRSLDIYVLRGTSAVTTLICEDLARHDPCQELVRGIGPNIVFALLMDGPQLKDRWPGRYATVLAEDPGSSVLSLTSLGLVERSNATGLQMKPSRSIGLWRDDQGQTSELVLPSGMHALCLSLQATPFSEHTLDGRSDGGVSESWRLSGIQPVKAPETAAAKAVLDGKWPG
ncbi:MAG: hypothetical protein E5V74_01460 [Mesorhizobium sp.]|nr:MAG: hypothetical protein E5W03_01535 [Mesorhizobium sp.]TIV67144.1 MAG: hypothetical protein E5V86_05940 [Mesorhizobium sp.]TIW05798.1 MAG: hypothetical protein E5V74_01460 [Mesorhizobium sp.]